MFLQNQFQISENNPWPLGDPNSTMTVMLNLEYPLTSNRFSSFWELHQIPCIIFHQRFIFRLNSFLPFLGMCARKSFIYGFWLRYLAYIVSKMLTISSLYQLECEVRCEQAWVVIENHDLWHQRLGHLNSQQLYKMVQQNHISGIKLSPRSGESTCEGCIVGKMQRKPFKSVDHKQSSKKLELIHSDICGPFQVDSIGGSRYFATFIDDYSRCVATYFLKHKSEALK